MRSWLNTLLHHTLRFPFNMKLSWKNLLWFIVSLFLDPQITELFFFNWYFIVGLTTILTTRTVLFHIYLTARPTLFYLTYCWTFIFPVYILLLYLYNSVFQFSARYKLKIIYYLYYIFSHHCSFFFFFLKTWKCTGKHWSSLDWCLVLGLTPKN